VAGGGSSFEEDVLATEAKLYAPFGIAFDRDGNLYFTLASDRSQIRRIDSATMRILTVAGNARQGFSGDGQDALEAQLNRPRGLAFDRDGNLLISDTENHRIRKVNRTTGIISTIAGNGQQGYTGDNVDATVTALNWPTGIIVDDSGNILFADASNNRIRKIDAVTGIMTTVAGGGNRYNVDNIPALEANIGLPVDVALDEQGNLFIVDYNNDRVLRVKASDNTITTVVGKRAKGQSLGDGGTALEARLNDPNGVAVIAGGHLLIADSVNNRVRIVRGPIP
jgi:sugar lactone lactonase YvrE